MRDVEGMLVYSQVQSVPGHRKGVVLESMFPPASQGALIIITSNMYKPVPLCATVQCNGHVVYMMLYHDAY